MPFFNFRRGGSGSASNAAAAAQPASAEMLRKRARHRLIGAAVLVLIGVIGFPLLFDTQPRPMAVDIPIVIPGKVTAPPLAAPVAVAPAPAAVSPAKPEPSEKVAAAASLAPQEEIVTSRPVTAPVESKPEPKPEAKPEPRVEAKPEHKPEPKPEAKPAPKPAVASDDGARARALLNGTAAPVAKETAAHPDAAGDARLIVQVGAFADAAKAHEARLKLERAGLKTYTQVADTKDGKRTRVRVGPFATKADAEKAAGKIRALDLPAAILTL